MRPMNMLARTGIKVKRRDADAFGGGLQCDTAGV